MKYKRKPVFIIVDEHPVHKSKKVKEYVESLDGKLHMFLLPPYAPDLNPDELVWNQLRHMGTSKKPLKQGESLKSRAVMDLEKIRMNQKLVKSFFNAPSVLFAAA